MAEEQTPDFAEMLRRARRAAGLSQEALAEKAGVSVSGISALERGVNQLPRRDTLDMLADALELSVDERRSWVRLRHQQAQRSLATAAVRAPPRAGAPLTNLPFQPTRFFGREHELAALTRLLREQQARLVTLSGPGGSGKTRLALQVAEALQTEYLDGVYFVDLSPLAENDLALAAIAAALGLRPRAGQPLDATLVEWFMDKRLLLILDNLEQILSFAPNIGEFVHRSSSMQILATSRAPLRLRAEREFPVQPLPLPPIDDAQGAASAVDQAAVQLFVDRARAVQPDFAVLGDEARVVARICRRLDGLPLAIELAAACVRLLPPKTILARLEQQLPLIDSSPRDAPARQRTVRDTLTWSYDLLAPDEQTLLRRLSIFKGGWTIDAAEAVVGGVAGAERIDVLQGLATLVEHSLVEVHEWFDGSPRFSMLNTIHSFSLDRLEHDEERNATCRRHADYFVWLFTGSERDFHTKRAETWLQRGAAEIENVRLALAWAVIHDPETALRLAREMAWIRFMHGATPESQSWLERARASAGDIPDDLRAGVLMWIGANATVLGDYAKAWAAHEEAVAINRALGHPFGVARNLHGLGRIAMYTGDAEQAAALYASAADILRDQRDPALIVTLCNLGIALLASGRLEQAAVVLDEALAYAERDGLPWHFAQILDAQGRVALARGNRSDARGALRRCLQLNRDARDPRFVAQALETCSWLAAIEGMAEHAARLLGAVSRIRETISVPVPPSTQIAYDRYVPIAQAQLSNAAWQAAFAEGQTLSQAEVIEVALQGLA